MRRRTRPGGSRSCAMDERVRISVNGRACEARAGQTLAAALMNAGECATRVSVTGEKRGPVCGMGVCFECRVTVDGVEHERACVRRVAEGMEVETGLGEVHERGGDGWVAEAGRAGSPLKRAGELQPRHRAALGGTGTTAEAVAYERARPLKRPEVQPRQQDPSTGAGVAACSAMRECDVLVIGAGPAGLKAAWSAATASTRKRVLVLDDNAHTGGQIWRGDAGVRSNSWREGAAAADVEVMTSCAVVQDLGSRELLIQCADGACVVRAGTIVIATGASELFLPFPGWTLPNVMGVGGLQAMVKGGLDIRGKRIVIAGSGPLLLAVAASLRSRGAEVVLIAEQADAGSVRSFGARLAFHPAKLVQGAALKARLLGVPYLTSAWPVAAHGDAQVREVEIARGSVTRRVACDYLACGFGLVPRGRVGALLGCAMDGFAVRVDELCRASVAGVFGAGECVGIGGVDKAITEGMVAGAMAAGDESRACSLARTLPRERRFAAALAGAFTLRRELRALAAPETIVCRCEDVTLAEISRCASWRDAKLQTRCGMGPCQGRVCGPAVSFLRGWEVGEERPPVLNVPLGTLATMHGTTGASA